MTRMVWGTYTDGISMGVVAFLTAIGLFIGASPAVFSFLVLRRMRAQLDTDFEGAPPPLLAGAASERHTARILHCIVWISNPPAPHARLDFCYPNTCSRSHEFTPR